MTETIDSNTYDNDCADDDLQNVFGPAQLLAALRGASDIAAFYAIDPSTGERLGPAYC